MGDRAAFVSATQGRIETSEIPFKVPTGTILRSSCNGLVLHRWCAVPTGVTNPLTRQQFVLPSFPFAENEMTTYGFGPCGIACAADSMEYKVVLTYKVDREQVFLGILSVGSGKPWRHVGVEHLSVRARSLLRDTRVMACTSEGFITWSSYEDGSYLKLDVETEILTMHPSSVPEACLVGTYSIYLSTGRSLMSLLLVHRFTKYLIELWEMMAESGEWRKVVGDIKLGAHERWLRQFDPWANALVKPLGWVRYPEVLALSFSHCGTSCIFFNLNTQQISSIELSKEAGYILLSACP